MTTTNQNQTTRPVGNPTPEEEAITDTLKIRRITEIIQRYYRPQDERIIAPENVIERINRVIRS